MRANRHTREAVTRGVGWTAHRNHFRNESVSAVHGEPVGMRTVVSVRKRVRCGIRRSTAVRSRGDAVVDPTIGDLRGGRVAVVNVG